MATIEGHWEFHRACPAQRLSIAKIDGTGALLDSFIDGVAINGHYDKATNAISFNDAQHPGAILFVSFYTGYVIPDGDGGSCAMAGTYQEAEFLFEEAVLGREAEAGVIPPNFRPGYTTLHAAWYAVQHTR
jgi:hypothetical protein